jgi:hypothetical protein
LSMIRSRVSSRVKRLRANWVVIKVMKYIIRHIFALSMVRVPLCELIGTA